MDLKFVRDECSIILEELLMNNSFLNLKREHGNYYLINNAKKIDFSLPNQRTQFATSDKNDFDIPFWVIASHIGLNITV